MAARRAPVADEDLREAVEVLGEATAAKKCWSCGCLHHGLEAIEKGFPAGSRPATLDAAIRAARERLVEVAYDCLGCEICYPAVTINALNQIAGAQEIVETCPAAPAEARAGWPPLPGSYTVLRYRAPVAVCTLTDESLMAEVARGGDFSLAIVGTLQTENLGIERLVSNILANPNIRFLILCGADSRQAVGHLPGQSVLAMANGGVDERMRIVGAPGKRPVVRNLSLEAVEHFRRTVEIVNLIGQAQVSDVLAAAGRCAERSPGPAEAFAASPALAPIQGYVPDRMLLDPTGYFVIYLDRDRRLLSLEHYKNDGVLDALIEGRTAPELYIPAVERGLVSRLDHAAYLGRELARAEHAITSGEAFVQDAASEAPAAPPVPPACGCGESHAKDGAT